MKQKADKTKDLNKIADRHKKGKESNSFCLLPFDFLLAKSSAFSLVEILIVVGILGILAAIVMPEYQNHSQQAKEAAAKDNLRILRNVIQVYAAEHNGLAPVEEVANADTASIRIIFQLCMCTDSQGNTNGLAVPSDDYPYGPYFSKPPRNPYNDKNSFKIIIDGNEFPATPDGNTGWYYKPSTREIKINYPGTDSAGDSYYAY